MSHKLSLNVDEEELIKQDLEFQKSNCSPAAKLIRAGKRKNESSELKTSFDISTLAASEDVLEKVTNATSNSRFAQSRKGNKKKKDCLADYTVLQEAVSKQESKTVVLGRIIERNVPLSSPHLSTWTPISSPFGFPKVMKMINQDSNNQKPAKKSLYMQQVERNCKPGVKGTEASNKSSCQFMDEKLKELGEESFIVHGETSLKSATEASRIHQENILLLAEMSHEKRLQERNELMDMLSPEQLQFIRSLRTAKATPNTKSFQNNKMDVDTSASPSELELVNKIDEVEATNEKGVTFDSDVKMNDGTVENAEVLSDLPIAPGDAKRWLHMDKVELDKLRWTTEVPPIKPLKNNEGYAARFNFEGDLLPYESEISWREGLHHHGNEPGRPGYTMDELFIFVRSNVSQQRHIGLKTLANILRNAKEGLYDTCFDTPILQLMVDAGLGLLLRFAIDETSNQIYQEALRALYYLICCEPDEKCLHLLECWVPQDTLPGISSDTHSREKDRKELDEEEKELKDVEVIQLDIIRALVRMDVHIRLRYFLESVTLSPPDVIYILGILRRISYHSLTAAWTIASTPRLLSVIAKHFMPHNVSSLMSGKNIDKVTSIYGIPLRHAISLFKVLASQGRNMASLLINNYDLMNRILAYVSVEANQISMPEMEVLALMVESYGLWSIFLSYSLTKAQYSFSSFYPLLIKQLLFYRDKIDIDNNIMENQYNYDIGSHIVNVAIKALCIASTRSLLLTRMKNNEPTITTEDGKNEVLQPPVLDWEEFNQIFSLVENCVYKWMTQLLKNPEISFSGLRLIGCFFNFLTTYYGKWRDQYSFEGVKVIKKIENIYTKVLNRSLISEAFLKLLRNLKSYSILLCKLKPGNLRDPKNLGSVACVCYGGQVVPILQKDSPFPFLLHLFSFLKVLLTVHPMLEQSSISSVVNSKEIESYFSEICVSAQSLKQNWLSRVEVFTIVKILEIGAIIGCAKPCLYHKTAVSLMPAVHKGDEHLVKTLLTSIICNTDFIKDISGIESQIDKMTFKDYVPLKSPAIQQPIISPRQLTQSIVDSLPLVGQDLVKNLIHSKSLELSLFRYNSVSFLTNTLMKQSEEFPLVLDNYWCLCPLKLMTLIADKQKAETDQTSPEIIISVTRWLQMTFLLLKFRTSVMEVNTNPTGWIRHLSLTFLASNDLFLDVRINSYLQSCLATILENENYKHLDCKLTFPDLSFCFDWYKSMVEQYGSVSYGDSTFALFILIPLQRYWPETYRTFLFGEQSEILPFVRLTTEEVSQFVPIQQFLEPPEDDENVILKYKSALGSGLINSKRSPFLFEFTAHHVRNFANLNHKGTKTT